MDYEVLSDQGNAVARQFGIVYKLGDAMNQVSAGFGLDLTQFNGDDPPELPLPGTFVIDQSGTIQFAQAFADHSQRTEPSAILETLRGMT